MRNPEPLEGVPWSTERYDGANQDRYADEVDYHKGPAGTYNFRAVTLEEEAYNGGWLPGARPTSTAPVLQGDDPRPLARNLRPNDLFTVGMRGEPGWDDDPQLLDGAVTHPPAKDGDNSSYD